MKSKIFTLISLTAILISFLLGGCAGSKIERTVQDDNIFYSSNRPKIRIKINPDFRLQEKKDEKSSDFSEDFGERASNVKMDQFFFYNRISEKQRVVVITIQELTTPGWFFRPEIFNAKNELDSGESKIQGKTYKYCIFTVARPQNDLLVKAIGRISGADKNCMIKIAYLEEVSGDWSNIDLLTADQQRLLNEFVKDSNKDIQILE